MDFYPLAGEIDTEYLLSLETIRTKPLSREQARKFAQILLRRRDNHLDEMREEMSMDCPSDFALSAPDDDVWDKISRDSVEDTYLALLPNGNRTNGTVDQDHPALAVFLPRFGKEYAESDDDDKKSDHQSLFDNFSSGNPADTIAA